LRRDHITPHACNFLPEDVIKRPGTEILASESRRTDMDRFINILEGGNTSNLSQSNMWKVAWLLMRELPLE
jgi:hypothetical protein